MKFPASFKRYVGAAPPGGVVLGTDTLPTGKALAAQDNVLFSRFQNVNGWPCHRIAVTYAGPGGAPSVTGTMYFYEDSTQKWYRIGAAHVPMALNAVTFFDVVAVLEMPNTRANLADATPGSIAQLLIVDDPGGTPAGEYDFALAPDLTTQA